MHVRDLSSSQAFAVLQCFILCQYTKKESEQEGRFKQVYGNIEQQQSNFQYQY